jgi:hypothetical protein
MPGEAGNGPHSAPGQGWCIIQRLVEVSRGEGEQVVDRFGRLWTRCRDLT